MEFMDKAIELSIENVIKNEGGPFGCVIVSDENQIIGIGKNEVTKRNDPTCHAEIIAIRDACNNLKTPFLENCSIYTSCEPCPMCYGAIKWAKINKIYYCNTREDAKRIKFDDDFIYERIINNDQGMIRLNNNKAIIAFNKWKESLCKKEY
jgi:tRNA(Arg) A34 adenosine deaminase TadA